MYGRMLLYFAVGVLLSVVTVSRIRWLNVKYSKDGCFSNAVWLPLSVNFSQYSHTNVNEMLKLTR